jgi:hypothetical protein
MEPYKMSINRFFHFTTLEWAVSIYSSFYNFQRRTKLLRVKIVKSFDVGESLRNHSLNPLVILHKYTYTYTYTYKGMWVFWDEKKLSFRRENGDLQKRRRVIK